MKKQGKISEKSEDPVFGAKDRVKILGNMGSNSWPKRLFFWQKRLFFGQKGRILGHFFFGTFRPSLLPCDGVQAAFHGIFTPCLRIPLDFEKKCGPSLDSASGLSFQDAEPLTNKTHPPPPSWDSIRSNKIFFRSCYMIWVKIIYPPYRASG